MKLEYYRRLHRNFYFCLELYGDKLFVKLSINDRVIWCAYWNFFKWNFTNHILMEESDTPLILILLSYGINIFKYSE